MFKSVRSGGEAVESIQKPIFRFGMSVRVVTMGVSDDKLRCTDWSVSLTTANSLVARIDERSIHVKPVNSLSRVESC